MPTSDHNTQNDILIQLVKLENKIDGCSLENQQILKDIKAVDNNLSNRLNKIEYILNGNGTPGLIMKLAIAEKDITDLKVSNDESKEERTWLLRSILAAGVTALVSLGVTIFRLITKGN